MTMTHRHEPRHAVRRQAGMSIVELMVAVAIGLFMIAGFIGSFISMKRAFVAQDRLAELQDNERLALNLLSATVRAAGYHPDPLSTSAEGALPAGTTAYGNFAAGQGIVGTGGHASPTHTITTRYVAAPGEALTNCLGQSNTSASPLLMLNTYTIGPQHELMCSLDGGATNTVLVSNVTSMSVLYGTDSSGVDGVDRYLTADEVTAGALWPQVRSARLTVRFANPYASEPGESATIDWVQTVNLMNRT